MALRRKDLIQWIVFGGFLGVLLFTDLGTEIKAGFQRLILHTGLLQPQLPENNAPLPLADYQASFKSFDGQLVDLNDLKGKVIFINFWASWCPPCLAEMPEIEELYHETSSDDIVFLMVSVDENQENARVLMKKKNYAFPAYLPISIPAAYAIPSIPTTYVISPQGKIAFSKHGLADYSSKEFISFLKNLE